jgi:hypothetical protein
MQQRNAQTICSIMIFLYSCSQVIEIDNIDLESSLIVNSIAMPDSTFKVFLSKTMHYQKYEEDNWLTEGAEVVLLRNGMGAEKLHLVDNESYFESNLLGNTEDEFNIEVTYPGFQTLFSKTNIPKSVAIDTCYEIVSAGYIENLYYSGNFSSTHVSFTDPLDSENYYEIMVYRDFTRYLEAFPPDSNNEFRTYPYRIRASWTTDEVITKNGLDHSQSYRTHLFSDVGYNGKVINLTLNNLDNMLFSDADIYVVLYAVTKEYYEYKLSLVNQLYSRAPIALDEVTSSDFINPKFFKTISPVKGNIENGLGIFAGMSFEKKQCSVHY